MTIGFTSSVADFDQKQFDGLDVTAGIASSYDRLRQRERDARWSVRYVGWTEDDLLKAAIPVYQCRTQVWPDEAYDPRTWNLPDNAGDEGSPASSLLVGGCSERRSGLHVDTQAGSPDHLRSVLVEVAGIAADENRCLVFPFHYTDARNALAAATDDRIVWTQLSREARLVGLSDAQWESKLPAKVRYELRRDRRRIEAFPMKIEETTWGEVQSWAADLIAAHNIRLGMHDGPDFVRFRHAEWQRNHAVEVKAFTAEVGELRGVLMCFVWGNEIEAYEIGISGEQSFERHALYINLLFHAPLEYARSRGLDQFRLGTKAETPKASRGAVFADLHGGVLSIAETRRLAGR